MSEPRPELADFHRDVLMEEMMETVGVDLMAVVDLDGGQSYVRARAKCHGCTCKSDCQIWLAEHDEGSPQPFCPNTDLFQIVRDDC